jgi:hypothetical protein
MIGSRLTRRRSSYPTAWNAQPQGSVPHTPGSATYPVATAETYPKMPLSGTGTYTAEPQEMPMQPTSMAPAQMPLAAAGAAHDPHQQQHQHPQHHHHQHHQQQPPPPPIRTQYAGYSSAPPHHLSLSTTAGPTSPDNSLAVPRYIGDTNPRPTKSPRHASHQSVASSISNETATGEYRYGPPPPQGAYPGPAGGAGAGGELSPQSQQHPGAALPPPNTHAHAQGGSDGSVQQSAGASGRDYYPSSHSAWGTTAAGDGSSYNTGGSGAGAASAQGGGSAASADRPYGYPVKQEQHAHHPGTAATTGNYGWNPA